MVRGWVGSAHNQTTAPTQNTPQVAAEGFAPDIEDDFHEDTEDLLSGQFHAPGSDVEPTHSLVRREQPTQKP